RGSAARRRKPIVVRMCGHYRPSSHASCRGGPGGLSMRAMQRVSLALGVALLLSAAAYAGDRPHEGKITNVDSVAKAITVQGEKGDSWTLNLSETTKMKNKLTFEE